MIVFYRPGSGEPAAAVVRMYGDAYIQSIGYNAPLPDHVIGNETVYLFGVRFTEQELVAIADQATDIVFIDHRDDNNKFIESIRQKHQHFNSKIKTITDENTPMSIQVWKHFFPREEVPRAIQYFGQYMVWDLSDQCVIYFNYGLVTLQRDQLETWLSLIRNENQMVDKILHRGKEFYSYYDALHQIYASFLVYKTTINKVPVLAANTRIVNSMMFDYVDKDKAKLGVLYAWQPKQKIYSVSLYRLHDDDTNAAEIANNYFGGGSSFAAGFRWESLPFHQRRQHKDLLQGVNLAKAEKTVQDSIQGSGNLSEETPLQRLISDNNQRQSYQQYEAVINGSPVIAANLPHLSWKINRRIIKAADIKVSWFWNAREGSYGLLVKDLNLQQTNSEDVAKRLGLQEYFISQLRDNCSVINVPQLPFD